MTAKTRAIPSLYRDNFPGLPGQVPSRILRRVTFTNFIAVPLVLIGTSRADMKLDSNILLNLYHD
jgi:hypothetical protein